MDAQERIGAQGGATASLSRFTRGGIHGCDPDDWLQAERELQENYNKSSGE